MNEKYVIIAFNPDGTENVLKWAHSLKVLKETIKIWRKKERKEWIDDGGEYHILEIID